MKQQKISTLQQLGSRISTARQAAGWTQEHLARSIGLDRSALSRMESGQRRIDVVELAAMAEALGVSVDFFLRLPPPEVLSQRPSSAVADEGQPRVDWLASDLAADLQTLVELGALKPVERFRLRTGVSRIEDAEVAAAEVRRHLGIPRDPLLDLAGLAEKLALFTAVTVRDQMPEGLYSNLDAFGVAWIEGNKPAGRRRFTLAHELGHHVFEDEYRVDWSATEDETERIVNAFAIHLLLPRSGAEAAWQELASQALDERARAIVVAARFGVSWTAACAQLLRFGLLSRESYEQLLQAQPRRGDFAALEVSPPEELVPPFLSPSFCAAILRAYRRGKISADRAMEMLRGALTEEDLPDPDEAPLAAYDQELEPWL